MLGVLGVMGLDMVIEEARGRRCRGNSRILRINTQGDFKRKSIIDKDLTGAKGFISGGGGIQQLVLLKVSNLVINGEFIGDFRLYYPFTRW